MAKRSTSLLATAAALAACGVAVQLRTRAAERAHRVRGRFVNAGGVRLHCLERGSGSSLVLLHGLGSMIDDFVLSGLFARAAERHRAIAVDRPGYGRSERPRRQRWTLAAQAELLHEALRRLDVYCPVLFGHSLGATLALAYALRYPVERLVLASGYYFPTPRLDAPFLLPPAVPVIGDLLRYTVSPLAGRLAWPLWLRLLFAPGAVPRRFRAFPTWMALRPSQLRAMAEDTAVLMPEVLRMMPAYPRLNVPTVLIAGAEDRYVSPRAHTMRLHAGIPGAELVLIPGAGHMVHHQACASVARALLADHAPLDA